MSRIYRFNSLALLCCVSICFLLLLPIVNGALTADQMTMLQTFFSSTGGAAKWTVFTGWDLAASAWVDPCATTDPVPKLFGVSCLSGQLQEIYLPANGLSGVIPPTFFDTFPSLSILELLSNPELGGPIPAAPASSLLEIVILSECAFNGTIPDSIFTGALTQLQLQGNQLTGGIPDSISNSRQLFELNLGSNHLVVGALSTAVINCTQLSVLDLTDCGVTSVPDTLSSLGGLTQLALGINSLTGSIPNSWCNMARLNFVFLQDNSGLSGTIPSCLYNWTALESLVIENTQMTGTIPEFFFTSFKKLTGLYLSGSKFSGVIPDMFDRVPNLQHAEFNGNNVDASYSGAFPNTLFGLVNLQSFSIQYTQVESPNRTMDALRSIQTIILASNPKMSVAFPSALLLARWTIPAPAGVQRTLVLANMPVYGTLPLVPSGQQIYDVTGGVSFVYTDITGYIPNATFDWVPSDQLNGVLDGCSKLLHPVPKWALYLTNNFAGLTFSLSSLTKADGTALASNIFSMSGGTTIGIAGASYVSMDGGYYYCGYCISGNTTFCESDDLNSVTADQMSANIVFTHATLNNISTIMFCNTPTVTRNMSIPVYLYYVGPAYTSATWYFLISSNSLSVAFYNPTPYFYALSPSEGRIEGCTTLYALGVGFFNAPNVTIRILTSVDIWVEGGVVLNDTAVRFLLPSANASAVNTKYRSYSDTPLSVDLFADGTPLGGYAISNATYTFATTCSTPLVECENGYTDDQDCPVQPLCRCFSEGQCLIPNGTTTYQCVCAGGFDGSGCRDCALGYYGSSCTLCDCSHGTCDDGIDGSGSCVCDSGYMGAKCSISKWGVGFGIPFAIVVVIIVALLIRKRHVNRLMDDPDYGMPMNSVRNK
ncbi:GP46-like surface antigen, putative [Bodo saltans]|nr:GP46-like surface antigen, putative [Bodo saltans]|eukprot:CUG89499.1 GP46-like surface antigen, putative [Bodo saltans]